MVVALLGFTFYLQNNCASSELGSLSWDSCPDDKMAFGTSGDSSRTECCASCVGPHLDPALTRPEMVCTEELRVVFRSPRRELRSTQESSAVISKVSDRSAGAWCQGLLALTPSWPRVPRRSAWQHKASLSPWRTVPERAWAFAVSAIHAIHTASGPSPSSPPLDSPGPTFLSSGCCLDILLLCYIPGACRQALLIHLVS